jgi:hypothetical protein
MAVTVLNGYLFLLQLNLLIQGAGLKPAPTSVDAGVTDQMFGIIHSIITT